MQEAIDRIQGGSQKITVIVIAHRLTTIQNAHKIVVLEKGEKREEGKHSALMMQDGLYAQLVRKQENAAAQVEDQKSDESEEEEEDASQLGMPDVST